MRLILGLGTKYIQTEYILEIILVKPTSTKTLPPMTSTGSTSATVVETTTTHSATTVTVAAVATRYAACESYTLGPRVNSGNYLADALYITNDLETIGAAASSGYDCCAACFNTPNCYFSAFASTNNQCFFEIGETCPANQPNVGVINESRGPNQFQGVYANGPCGSLGSNGLIDD
jgi:hypothetical protein